MEKTLRLPLSIALAVLAAPAFAGEPYTPVPLASAETLTPPADLIADATALLKAAQLGDLNGLAAGLAPTVTVLDGAIELAVPRHREKLGPYGTTEELLAQLSNFIGGDLPLASDGSDETRVRLEGERQFIVESLTDGRPWGTDPELEGAVCTYAYRTYDREALKALSEALETMSSSFVYVDSPYQLLASPERGAATVATLEPDRLYALDYETDAPIGWMAVHMPQGGSGFAEFELAQLDKPYVSGLCFRKNEAGRWVVVAQASTSL